jgi:biopolymer transport protein ExbD
MSYKPTVGAQMAAPNVIPMADIMLVLLIIFMVVTPMLSKGLSVELAKVNNPSDMPDADKDDAVIVGISASGDVYLGSAKSDLTQIADQVRDRISNKLDKTVFVKSDGRAKYGDVVKVVDEIRSAGVDNVGLITDRAEQQNRRAPPPPSGNYFRLGGVASHHASHLLTHPSYEFSEDAELKSGSNDYGNGCWRKTGRFDGDDERRPVD